jgi:hypothetical protein
MSKHESCADHRVLPKPVELAPDQVQQIATRTAGGMGFADLVILVGGMLGLLPKPN